MKTIYQDDSPQSCVPRLALKPEAAATALSMCRSTLDKNTAPKGLCIPSYRIGTRVFYPVALLQEWQATQVALQQDAAQPLDAAMQTTEAE